MSWSDIIFQVKIYFTDATRLTVMALSDHMCYRSPPGQMLVGYQMYPLPLGSGHHSPLPWSKGLKLPYFVHFSPPWSLGVILNPNLCTYPLTSEDILKLLWPLPPTEALVCGEGEGGVASIRSSRFSIFFKSWFEIFFFGRSLTKIWLQRKRRMRPL